MQDGRVTAATQIIKNSKNGSILDINGKIGNHSALNNLKEKHPKAKSKEPSVIVTEWKSARPYHQAIFDCIDAVAILKATLNTRGSAAPSGLNADDWRQLLTVFNQKSSDLCHAVVLTARKISTEAVNPEFFLRYNASRLIPLDKSPGVQPNGIGEIIRRIIGKSTIQCVQNEILS